MTTYTVTIVRLDHFELTVNAPDEAAAAAAAIAAYLDSERPEEQFGIAFNCWDITDITEKK